MTESKAAVAAATVLNISVESLKHLDELDDEVIITDLYGNVNGNNDGNILALSKHPSLVSPSPMKSKNASQMFLPLDIEKTSQFSQHSAAQSCNSGPQSMLLLRSMSEIVNPPQTMFQFHDQTYAGAVFLKNMFTGPAPVRNYLNYIKKDSVDLTDPCDSAIVMQILNKSNKTKKECDFLLKSIQGMHLFQKNKDMLAMKDCNQHLFDSLRVHHFPPKKTIFNYGEFGYTYYIVLSGAADLLIPSPNYEHERTESIPDSQRESKQTEILPLMNKSKELHENKRESIMRRESSISTPGGTPTSSSATSGGGHAGKSKVPSKWNVLKKSFVPDQEVLSHFASENHETDALLDTSNDDETQEDFLKRAFPGMNYIKTFKAGEAFGEIALMTKQRRTGSVVCREDTYLMSLTKQSFDVILGSYHENIIQRKLMFLKSYEFFRNMPNSKLLALLHLMKTVNYKNKNIVYTEGDPSRFIYFIREGEVQISQLCNINETQSSKQHQLQNQPQQNQSQSLQSQQQLQDNEHKHHHHHHHHRSTDDAHPEISAMRAKKDKLRTKNKRIPIVIKGKNSYFGEDEILKSIDFRQQQAICASEEAEIYLLKKDILYNYTRGYSVVDKLKEEFKVKAEWNQQRRAKIVETRKSTQLDLQNQINNLAILEDKQQQQQQSSQQHITSLSPLPGGQNSNQITTASAASMKTPAAAASTSVASNSNFFTKTGELSISNVPTAPTLSSILSNKSQRASFRATFTALPSAKMIGKEDQENPFAVKAATAQLINLHNEEGNTTLLPQIFPPRVLTIDTKKIIPLRINQQPLSGKRTLTPSVPISSTAQFFKSTYANPQAAIQFSQNNQQQQYSQYTDEELIGEKHLLDYLQRTYYKQNSNKSNDQLQREAKEHFGDISHSAFVNQMSSTIESKLDILKKLNKNGMQLPTGIGIHELFDVSNSSKMRSRKIQLQQIGSATELHLPQSIQPSTNNQTNNNNNTSIQINNSSSLSFSPSMQLIQRKIIKQQNSKKSLTSISNSSMQAFYHIGRQQHHSNHRRTLSNQPNPSALATSRSQSTVSCDDIPSCESSRSLKRFVNVFPTPSATIYNINNDLDVLEEVSENNSPVKYSESKRSQNQLQQQRSRKASNRLNQMVQIASPHDQSLDHNCSSSSIGNSHHHNMSRSAVSHFLDTNLNSKVTSYANTTAINFRNNSSVDAKSHTQSMIQDSFTISTPTSTLTSRVNISNRIASENKKATFSRHQLSGTTIPVAAKENVFKLRPGFFALPSKYPQA